MANLPDSDAACGERESDVNCDWCGEPFADGEKPVVGYEDEPTHKDCQRAARRAWQQELMREHERHNERTEREPFTDWPNGQGTYD